MGFAITPNTTFMRSAKHESSMQTKPYSLMCSVLRFSDIVDYITRHVLTCMSPSVYTPILNIYVANTCYYMFESLCREYRMAASSEQLLYIRTYPARAYASCYLTYHPGTACSLIFIRVFSASFAREAVIG